METEDDVNLITHTVSVDNHPGLGQGFTEVLFVDESSHTIESVDTAVTNFMVFTQKPSTTEPVLVDFKEFFQAPHFAKPSNLIDGVVIHPD